MMSDGIPDRVRRRLLRLRGEMFAHLGRSESETTCCRRCRLPYPEGDFESYDFCPWCSPAIRGREPRYDESRKIIQKERDGSDEIQCGECGGEYEQPTRYPFKVCPHCGAPFAEQDEILIELPWVR